jgi:hypothetical protein
LYLFEIGNSNTSSICENIWDNWNTFLKENFVCIRRNWTIRELHNKLRLKTFDATASVIFETSLDTLVKKREFIPRRVFKYQKKTEAELNKSQED